MNKLGSNVSTNPTIGTAKDPSPTVAGAELTTETSTFFARPAVNGQPVVIYNADRLYAQVTFTLETAGPVIVGTKQQLYPVTSGKGIALDTGVPMSFMVAKGNRIWVATTSINRIKVTIQPLPWLEQITGLLGRIFSGLIGSKR